VVEGPKHIVSTSDSQETEDFVSYHFRGWINLSCLRDP
jgi:hypothetical protein